MTDDDLGRMAFEAGYWRAQARRFFARLEKGAYPDGEHEIDWYCKPLDDAFDRALSNSGYADQEADNV